MLEWGSVPDWFVAIGTVGAFWSGGWLLRREIRRDHQNSDAARRTQAGMVSAWVEEVLRTSGVAGSTDLVHEHRFTLMNKSNLPVYDAVIVTKIGTEMRLGNLDVGFVAPGTSFCENWPGPNTPTYTRARPVAFGFTDSAGLAWIRDSSGALFDGTPENWARLEDNGRIRILPRHRWSLRR